MQIRPASPAAASDETTELPIRLITHNIRYAATYFQRFPLEPPWHPTRHNLLTKQFHFLTRPYFSPEQTVIFLQEVLHQQFLDVANYSLGPTWTGLGVGRDDGRNSGEHEAVFFRNDAWRLVHWETRWINEDGAVGKKGWDAGSVRTATIVVLDAAGSVSKRVLFLNAHLDDGGVVARREGAKLLLRILAEFKEAWRVDYWILGGDFNSPKSDDAYETIAADSTGLVDAHEVWKGMREEWGEFATYTGFDGVGERHPEWVQRIDFVFVPNERALGEASGKMSGGRIEGGDQVNVAQEEGQGTAVQGYAVIPNSFEGSKEGRVSDHRAVVVDLLV